MMAPTAPLRAFCVVCINRLRTRREEWPAAGPPAFEKKGWGRCISVTSSRSVLILYLFPFPFLFFAMSILNFIFFFFYLSYSSVSSAFPSPPVPSLTSLSSRVPSLPPLCPRSVFRTSHGRSGSPIDRRGNLPCGRTPPRLHSPRSTSGLKLTWSLPPSRPPSLTPSSPHTLLPSRFPSLAPAFPHVLPSRPSSLTPSIPHALSLSRPPSLTPSFPHGAREGLLHRPTPSFLARHLDATSARTRVLASRCLGLSADSPALHLPAYQKGKKMWGLIFFFLSLFALFFPRGEAGVCVLHFHSCFFLRINPCLSE